MTTDQPPFRPTANPVGSKPSSDAAQGRVPSCEICGAGTPHHVGPSCGCSCHEGLRSAGQVTVSREHDGRIRVVAASHNGDGYAVRLTTEDAIALRDALIAVTTPARVVTASRTERHSPASLVEQSAPESS